LRRICVDSIQLKKNPKFYNPIAGAYAYKNLLNAAGSIALGTDFPVENISTLATFYAATQRKDIGGKLANAFLPNQALTAKQALLGMTLWAARSNFEERRKGSLEVGKLADFIEIDTDIITALPNQIQKAKIVKTYINGDLVWRK
jgi:predicted amidohydrolase YtcJ